MRRTILGFLYSMFLVPLAVAAPGPSEAVHQQRFAREVRHQLLMLPYYSVFDNLEFQVEGGKVILTGQVMSPVIKSDAKSAVKSIAGVTQVVNNIEVLPLSPMDDRLRRALYRSIYGTAGLDRYALQAVPPVHIIVKNGHATLEGVVASEGDKNLAGIKASTVPFLFSVENNLRVENVSN